MATTLSTAQYDVLQDAVKLVTTGTAPENQFHVDLADRVAPVAVAIGFSPSLGQFHEDVRDRPYTTILRLAAFIGKP